MSTVAATAPVDRNRPADADNPGADGALQRDAAPLVMLVSELRQAVPRDPAAPREALAQAVARFEADAAAHGCDAATVAAASYLLCVWVDEVVADTPWGSRAAPLLQQFHGETGGGARLRRLLARLMEAPQQHRALLQLFHACFSLGLTAGPEDREALRLRLHELLRTTPRAGDGALPAGALSLPWVAPLPATGRRFNRLLWGGVLALALLALGVFTAQSLRLAAQVDTVFAQLQTVEARSALPVAAAPVAGPTVPARLASTLPADPSAGLLMTQDEAHRSTVVLSADALFEPGTARLRPPGQAVLQRVAQAVGAAGGAAAGGTSTAQPAAGHLLVTVYTDGRDTPTIRLPSAWQQTDEWAEAAAAVLRQALPGVAVSLDSRGDSAPRNPMPGQATLRRRVDITWFP